jgi:hypothetical protein
VIDMLDKASIVIGVVCFILMTPGFWYLSIQAERDGSRTAGFSMVFKALSVMCGVFIVTSWMSPLFPEYAWLWRLLSRPPIFGVAFELGRVLYRVYR